MSLLLSLKTSQRLEAKLGFDAWAETLRAIASHRTGRRRAPTFRDALRSARASIKAQPALRAVDMVVLRADDSLWLIRIGARGGWRRLAQLAKPRTYVASAPSLQMVLSPKGGWNDFNQAARIFDTDRVRE